MQRRNLKPELAGRLAGTLTMRIGARIHRRRLQDMD
jgi:hypothetical protein